MDQDKTYYLTDDGNVILLFDTRKARFILKNNDSGEIHMEALMIRLPRFNLLWDPRADKQDRHSFSQVVRYDELNNIFFWESQDNRDFSTFRQYVVQGHYSVPAPEYTGFNHGDFYDYENYFVPGEEKRDWPTVQKYLESSRDDARFVLLGTYKTMYPEREYDAPGTPVVVDLSDRPWFSYENIWNTHLSMLRLANIFQLEGLAELATYNIQKTLLNMTPYHERLKELIRVLEDYYNLEPQEDSTAHANMRKTLAYYMACYDEHIRHNNDIEAVNRFHVMLNTQGDFAGEYSGAVKNIR
ncbi:hypothetical protein QQS21_010088 [Conoideocrella luteorostrata]|uniref:Uncharacterized protein n=1 Tax=Conoideocrella luteorostrata TaxID=1105319 RepID=A0AAJ0CK84_9HYPO|nr:hypothetical protein QQS21_010088 [Conoideocrella luteorostrata]